MVIIETYKTKLVSRKNQNLPKKKFLKGSMDAQLFLWRKFWHLFMSRLKQPKTLARVPLISMGEMDKMKNHIWKKSEELKWLGDYFSGCQKEVLRNFYRAVSECLGKKKVGAGLPRQKYPGEYKGLSLKYYTGQFKIEGNTVKLPKIGWFEFHFNKKILGKPKNVTITFDNFEWWISIQTEREEKAPVHAKKNKMIGLDLGVKFLAKGSDGSEYLAFDSHKIDEQIKKEQKSLSTKYKGKRANREKNIKYIPPSGNFLRTKEAIQKLHIKKKNSKKFHIHKITKKIIEENSIIFIEDLKTKNMTRSAKGTIEEPGRQVKQKSGLNRVILNQSWYEVQRQLLYKAEWSGATIIKVPPQHTSQQCNECGFIDKENRKTQKNFVCLECGHQADADVNAAKNILKRGLELLEEKKIGRKKNVKKI